MTNDLVKIWNINFKLSDLDSYINHLEELISKENKIVLNGVNPYSLSILNKNPQFLEALTKSTMANVDGVLLKYSLQLLGYKVPVRLDTPSIFERLMAICNNNSFRIFLLGSNETDLKLIQLNLCEKYNNIKIVGTFHGFFSLQEEDHIVEKIINSSTDIILIGMPSPKKEMFISRNYEKLNFKVSLGVGGVFDIIAGKKKPAPKWIKDLKLEWLYRFIQEPKRLFGRYIDMFKYFFLFVIKTRPFNKS